MITLDQTLSFWKKLFQGAVSGSSYICLAKSDAPTIVYPVSAVLADKDVMLCIKPGEHGSTYGGYIFTNFLTSFYLDGFCSNPLGCAVALIALSVLVDERLDKRSLKLGEYFRSSIRALNNPLVAEVRGRGLLNAVVINEKKSLKGRTAWQFCLLLKSRGVLAKPTHVNMSVSLLFFGLLQFLIILFYLFNSVCFAPPLVISEEVMKEAVKIIGECLVDFDQVSCSLHSFIPPKYVNLKSVIFCSWMRSQAMSKRHTTSSIFEISFFLSHFRSVGMNLELSSPLNHVFLPASPSTKPNKVPRSACMFFFSPLL